MRKIKFRGKSIDGKEWLYGDLVHSADKKRTAILVNDKESYDECEVDPETIGQFTGLYDSVGNEIYEGDRLFIAKSGKAFTSDVVWDEISGRFALDFGTILGISDMNLGGWLINYDCQLVSSSHSKKGGKK